MFSIGTPDSKGLTRWLCLDLDGGGHADGLVDPEAAVLLTYKICQSLGLQTYIERSGGGTHHRMLRSYALNDYKAVVPLLGLHGNERVVDAGGGTGALANLILEAHPGAKITLLDRPEVVEQVPNSNGEARLSVHASDIFNPWGVTADAVVLARVLHDWNDELATRILANARNCLNGDGRLLVVEMVLDDERASGGLCDLHLLCVTGGQERTVSQFETLFASAGFKLAEVRRAATLPAVLVGVPQ